MNKLPYIPVELQRIILEFRGTQQFIMLKTEISEQKRFTEKWRKSIINRLVDVYDKDIITHKEYQMLSRMIREKEKRKNNVIQ